MDTFAERFEKKRKGLSFSKLSKQTGISTSVLFGYAKGKIYPKYEHLLKVCTALDMNPNEEKNLIEREQKNKVFNKAKFSHLRKVFLEKYQYEYSELTQSPFTKQDLKKEFQKTDLHPIEKKLIEVIDQHLHSKKAIPQNTTIAATNFSEQEIKSLINKVLTEWGYIASGKQLIIALTSGKGIKDVERYKMETQIKWIPQNQDTK